MKSKDEIIEGVAKKILNAAMYCETAQHKDDLFISEKPYWTDLAKAAIAEYLACDLPIVLQVAQTQQRLVMVKESLKYIQNAIDVFQEKASPDPWEFISIIDDMIEAALLEIKDK